MRAEMRQLGAFLRQGFVMELARGVRVEAQVELVFPAELEAGLAERIVALAGGGVALGQVRGVGGDLVGDDAVFDVLLVRQAEVFLGRDVAEHGAAVPADHGRADGAGDMVVAGGDVGGERAERVEWRFVAPLELLVHVLLDEVHGDVAGALVHDLAVHLPGALRQFALGAQFGKLGLVVRVGKNQPADIRKIIGVQSQETTVDGDLTGRENITLQGHFHQMDSDEIKKRVNDLISLVGLEAAADRRARNYSGGMKKRLDLATALVHEPKILFLDEPTTGLDPQSRSAIWSYLEKLN